jgi:NAD(P)H-flavin reductase
VKKSVADPAAQWQWLWQEPASKILDSTLQVRVGGSFVWPPPGVVVSLLRKVVFVAGGVGVNPLMSMLSHLAEGRAGIGPNTEVHFLYSMRDPGDGARHAERFLFLDRIQSIFAENKVKGQLRLFLTSGKGEGLHEVEARNGRIPFQNRRVGLDDIGTAIGQDKRFSVVYVCGVPTMTDDFVGQLTSQGGLGLEPYRVLFEKWW